MSLSFPVIRSTLIRRLVMVALAWLGASQTIRANSAADSLEAQLLLATGTERVDLLNALSHHWMWEYPGRARIYAQEACELAGRLQYTSGLIYALRRLGNSCQAQGEYDVALRFYLASLEKDGELPASQLGRYSLAHAHSSIGDLYTQLGETRMARQYQEQALQSFKALNSDLGIAICERRLGSLALRERQYEQALTRFQTSLAMMEKIGDGVGIGLAQAAIGSALQHQGQLTKAGQYYRAALNRQKKMRNESQMAHTLTQMGNWYSLRGEAASALRCHQEALRLATRHALRRATGENYLALSRIYRRQGDFPSAYDFQLRYTMLRDSLYSDEKLLGMASLQQGADGSQRELEIRTLRKQSEQLLLEKEKNQVHLDRKQALIYTYGGLLLCFMGGLLLLYNRYYWKTRAHATLVREKETISRRATELAHQKDQTEERNASLAVAKLIIEEQNKRLKSVNADLEEKVLERTNELSKAYYELLQVNEELDTFVYRASHDLKGPLATFLGLCQLSHLDVKDEMALMYFGMLSRQAHRMERILQQLLQISRVKGHELQPEPVDFSRFAREAASFVNSVEGGQETTCETSVSLNRAFSSDPYLLRLVLESLLENAVHFRRNGESAARLHVSIQQPNPAHLCIRVADNGIGILPDVADRIFDRFFRGTERSSGSGLGLYIARLAAGRLGGHLVYQPAPSGGSVFELHLPALDPVLSPSLATIS